MSRQDARRRNHPCAAADAYPKVRRERFLEEKGIERLALELEEAERQSGAETRR
jgi:hypothetical protein